MKHRLIIKIEQEQRLLEQEALRRGLMAMGMQTSHTDNIIDHYRWLRSMQNICLETLTPRTKRCLAVAHEGYHRALEEGLRSLDPPAKLTHWTRAGRAMNRVFRQAARENSRG